MYDLVIVDEAKEELRHAIAYSREKWGKAHGKKYAKEFQEQIRALRTNPRLYPLRNNILPDIRIKIFKGNRIVYVIRENRKMVAVLAVLSLYQKIDKNKLKRRQKKVRRTSAGH